MTLGSEVDLLGAIVLPHPDAKLPGNKADAASGVFSLSQRPPPVLVQMPDAFWGRKRVTGTTRLGLMTG